MTAIPAAATLSPPIDIAPLLAPLPETGIAPPADAQDAALAAIEDARREDDPALPRGVWERTLKKADWKAVVALSTAYLGERGKSLKVALHLLDGLAHLHGFAGLAPALTVLAGLCEHHWPTLLPLPDEDGDMAARTNLLTSLNKRLPLLLAQLPLARPVGGAAGAWPIVTWDDYRRALFTDKAMRRQGAKPAEDAMAVFAAAIADTPAQALQASHHHLTAAEQALTQLQTALLLVCSDDRPSLAGAAEALAEIRNWIEVTLRERGIVLTAVEEEPPLPWDDAEEGFDEENDGAPHWQQPRPGMMFASREEAYAMLAVIADFLARTEPHSPTPYLLRRAVAWGSLPLHELIAELTQNRNDLATIFSLLGVTSEK